MDYEKDQTGNFERGYSQNNHRKVTGFGLSQDAKRPIAAFATAASFPFGKKLPDSGCILESGSLFIRTTLYAGIKKTQGFYALRREEISWQLI